MFTTMTQKYLIIPKSKCLQISKCRASLQKRGPDIGSTLQIKVNDYTALFSGNILWIQGENPTNQPYVDHKGNVLLWNGDAYSWNLTVKHLL